MGLAIVPTDNLRVLVIAPLGRDAELITAALRQSGIQSKPLKHILSAAEDFRRGTVGALLVAEEALGTKSTVILAAGLAEQPSWSELPVLVMIGGGKRNHRNGQADGRYLSLGKVTLLERPMHIATLVSSVKASLRARSRQYERKLAEEAMQKSEKLAAVGRLASSIAHEINNPLEAIKNALYLLSGTYLEENQKYYLNIARGELERVSEIATQTLAFNRHTNLRAKAAVSEILDSVLLLYQARLAGSKISVERRYGTTAPLMCNPGELRQVFVNLIGNAFDATRNGGRLIVRTRDAVENDQQGIRVTVADTGTGISAAVKAHLFEAFQSTKGSQGTGLGLWISKGIIDKHKGRVRVWSCTKPGHSGTVFSIFIPRNAVNPEESSQPALLEATGT